MTTSGVETDAGQSRAALLVTPEGKILVDRLPPEALDGQLLLSAVDLFAPSDEGPDLLQPRSGLRIIPGKVAGEPHLAHSRLTTRVVVALGDRGMSLDQIGALYPHEDATALGEALELEHQLAA